MAISATDVHVLNAYAKGVMGRADHHAGRVKAVCLALLGGIVWRADPGSIEIKQYAGNLANMLWWNVGDRRFAIKYNHASCKIEIHDRTSSGEMLGEFDNGSHLEDVEKFFDQL